MSLVSLPQELYPIIFHNLDYKALCQLPYVSKGLKELFSKDELWRNLFFTNFPNEPLLANETAKKQFLARARLIPVKNERQLRKVVKTFILNLKWNKKRELICTFSNEPTYSLKISQSFGPVRGTKDGSNGSADETEYYEYLGKYLGSASDETSTENFIEEKFTQCPGARFNSFGVGPEDQNGIPLSITTNLVCRPHIGIQFKEGGYHYGRGPEIDFLFHYYVNGGIPDVDVGFGNTLGYFSKVNDWKKPFKLFCITDSDSNKPVWVGLIPLGVDFKFISIDSKGAVTWERGENRHITGQRSYDESGHYDLERSLRNHPIRFS